MIKAIAITLIAYLLWTAICYFRWKTPRKGRKQNEDWDEYSGKMSSKKFDIVGKSKFKLSHSLPEDATNPETEKAIEIQDTFVPQHEKIVPVEMLDETFSETSIGDENEPIDIFFPLEYEPEEEDENEELLLPNFSASGFDFQELGEMLRTIDRNLEATDEEKEQAGSTLLEIRKTDMFEQLVSKKPDRKEMVTQLIEDALKAFRREKDNEAEVADGIIVPENFDIRNYI